MATRRNSWASIVVMMQEAKFVQARGNRRRNCGTKVIFVLAALKMCLDIK